MDTAGIQTGYSEDTDALHNLTDLLRCLIEVSRKTLKEQGGHKGNRVGHKGRELIRVSSL